MDTSALSRDKLCRQVFRCCLENRYFSDFFKKKLSVLVSALQCGK